MWICIQVEAFEQGGRYGSFLREFYIVNSTLTSSSAHPESTVALMQLGDQGMIDDTAHHRRDQKQT